MSPDAQRAIASIGGHAAHATGKAHRFTPEQARVAGRKGGLAIASRPWHMAAIGKKGGHVTSGNLAHMSAIGKKGGAAISSRGGHMSRIASGERPR